MSPKKKGRQKKIFGKKNFEKKLTKKIFHQIFFFAKKKFAKKNFFAKKNILPKNKIVAEKKFLAKKKNLPKKNF